MCISVKKEKQKNWKAVEKKNGSRQGQTAGGGRQTANRAGRRKMRRGGEGRQVAVSEWS